MSRVGRSTWLADRASLPWNCSARRRVGWSPAWTSAPACSTWREPGLPGRCTSVATGSGQPGAYRYLSDTVDSYRTPEELLDLAGRAGWGDPSIRLLTLGTVGLVAGVKLPG